MLPDGEYAQAMTHVVGMEIACSCQRKKKSQLTNKIDASSNGQKLKESKWELGFVYFFHRENGIWITGTGNHKQTGNKTGIWEK